MRHLGYVLILLLGLAVSGCGGAKLSVADEQMARGEYFDASKTYRKVYNKLTKKADRPLRGEIAFKMGECYRHLGMAARASAAYQNAIRYAYPDSMALLYRAQSLHEEGKYQAAIQAYEEYLALDAESELAKTGSAGAWMAQKMRREPTRYVVKQSKIFNSRRADFSPMYAGKDLDLIYFTTTNEKVTGTHRSEITGMKKSDIWMARKNERGEWLRPEAVEGELNTENDEGIISITPDGNTMYLTRARREPHSNTGVEIYTSQRSDAKWSGAQKFEITADTLSNYGHPAVSPDGRYLYFTSDRPGRSGGYDLWRIDLKERARSLENMGEFINTPG
ncbi:MAG: tetratricopeptide repeat protein, partial [Muribaculaceae bacterium]|nr:tetratricopeptide repeat protein [Muribaculaceae bacterium]